MVVVRVAMADASTRRRVDEGGSALGQRSVTKNSISDRCVGEGDVSGRSVTFSKGTSVGTKAINDSLKFVNQFA
jgi:hypothetical protein